LTLNFNGAITITWKDCLEVGGFLVTVWRAWVAHQKTKGELKWQSETLVQLSRKSGTIPPPRGPRSKMLTLSDEWSGIVEEAKDLPK
jgi:hypothetical protein